MITLHFHLQPQYKYELFHINFTYNYYCFFHYYYYYYYYYCYFTIIIIFIILVTFEKNWLLSEKFPSPVLYVVIQVCNNIVMISLYALISTLLSVKWLLTGD